MWARIKSLLGLGVQVPVGERINATYTGFSQADAQAPVPSDGPQADAQARTPLEWYKVCAEQERKQHKKAKRLARRKQAPAQKSSRRKKKLAKRIVAFRLRME